MLVLSAFLLTRRVFRNEKEAILREQQQAIMRPVVYAMRKVQLITSTAAETPMNCGSPKISSH